MRYLAPTTVDEAITMIGDAPGARVFAGATDVVPQIRAGRPAPDVLVDLKGIERCMTLAHANGMWRIGAAVPAARLTRAAELAQVFPGLVEAAGLIGSDQIQNRSSLGGNLCNASPAADAVPALLVNDARAVVAGPEGPRTVPVATVTTGPGRTALAADEFIIEFEIDEPPAWSADAYLRLTPRTEMDIAVVGAAARIALDGDRCVDAAIALGAVAPTARRVPDAERALLDSNLDETALDHAKSAARECCDPIDDKRGTVAYRHHVAAVLTERAVHIAAARARKRRATT